ncbi:solute carrier family 30 member 3 isoform 1-T1 [Glossina fuscipes fuscipes]
MSKQEDTPIIVDFKQRQLGGVANYGSAGNLESPGSPASSSSDHNINNNHPSHLVEKKSSVFCLHGQRKIEVRDYCYGSRVEGVDKRARRKLITASILCLFFMLCMIVGGILSNSLAIATDAAHLLTDLASFLISLFAIWLAGRPSTERFSFGWYRAEVIGALVSVIMIWVITAILVWLAIERCVTQDFEVNAAIMLITSGIAIVVNLIMGFQLQHGHGVGMAHAHSSGDGLMAKLKFKKSKSNSVPAKATLETIVTDAGHQHGHGHGVNINVRAAFIHVLGDMLNSVGVFVAALIIYFRPQYVIADPVCTFIFSIIVLFTTFAIMKDALLVLMEGTPNFLEYTEILNVFKRIEGVERVHNLRIWALSINRVALSVHLAIGEGVDAKKVLETATIAVHKRYHFFETTIQIEGFSPEVDICA